jgi:aspartate 1-decarboxylase
MRSLLKCKINNLRVTGSNVDYEGSITVPKGLMEKADLWEGERVLVVDDTSGERLETYVIEGKDENSVEMNGAAAHRIKRGDRIRLMSFELSKEKLEPKNILVDENNRFVKHV